MNDKELIYQVKRQLAYDLNCHVKDMDNKNMITPNFRNPNRRTFFQKENFLYGVNFGTSTIVSCDDQIKDWIESFLQSIPNYRFYDAVQMNVLNNELKKYNQQINSIGEYFLPKVKYNRDFDINYHVRTYRDEDIKELYKDDRFPMALLYKEEPNRKDIIAVVAYENKTKIMGVAGATKDGEYMASVGVDVLPEYRRKGVALTLTNILTKTLLKENIIPYIGTSIGNIASKTVAYKAGYYPAWIELYSKTIEESNTFLPNKYQIKE